MECFHYSKQRNTPFDVQQKRKPNNVKMLFSEGKGSVTPMDFSSNSFLLCFVCQLVATSPSKCTCHVFLNSVTLPPPPTSEYWVGIHYIQPYVRLLMSRQISEVEISTQYCFPTCSITSVSRHQHLPCFYMKWPIVSLQSSLA